MRIYISCDGELIEKEIIMKEWREVLVEIDSRYYLLDFITIDRLHQEYINSKENNEAYVVDTTTIIVDEVSKKNVIDTLLNTDTTAFNGLNPIDLSETYKSTFQELSCIENWIKIY